MTGARFLAETIHGYGVTHVFFMESILRATLVEMESLGIRRVLTHSEAAAAYMADGYARASRRPGVCMCQSVGAANLAAGLQDAFLGRSPVVAITGRKPGLAQGRNAYQEIPHRPVFSEVTKYDASLDSLEQMRVTLPRAFREAVSGTPRPVHLDVLGLMGEFLERAEDDLTPVVEGRYSRYPSHRSSPESADVIAAASMLRSSQRPVIVAGWGAVVSGAASQIQSLAEVLSAPVAFSLDGKGIIPEDHRSCIGVAGSYSAPCTNRLIAESDLVIFVGCDTGDQTTLNWTVPGSSTPIIQIDADAAELGRNYPGALGILGDPQLCLQALLAALPASVDHPWRESNWLEHCVSTVAEWKESMQPHRASSAIPIRVERLCAEIAAQIPRDSVFVSDTGYSSIWSGTMIPLPPSCSFLRAAGSLGWAFPASLGAKCAAPERPVICFTGDGGFYYHLSELETAARHRIATVTIVNNNSGFGQCLVPVERVYAGRPGNAGDLTRFGPTNFARLAEDMGCLGIRVEHPEEIAPALAEAIAAKAPVVVDVATDPRPRAPAPWTPESTR